MSTDFFDQLDRPIQRPTHPAAMDEELLMRDVVLSRGRASGPGGQHRNKVETHITVTHTPSGLDAQAGERRLAKENQRVAVRRLRLRLALGVRVEVPIGEIRSECWRRRCPKRKIVCSTKHWEFPSMLAEALDVIDACGYDLGAASKRLECSGTQLLRFIAQHPPALVMVNARRSERGLRVLRA